MARPLDTLGCLALLAATSLTAQWKPPVEDDVRPPLGAGQLTVSKDELTALRLAYEKSVPLAVKRVRDAEKALKSPLVFPPRGGQHNQWYQCDACQFALSTIDATHHQCRRCTKVYSGEPYDDVIFSRVHRRNMARANTAAWAYRLSGRTEFAKETARILAGYADRYTEYPYHTASRSKTGSSGGHLLEQTLSEASLLVNTILPAYDLVRATLTAGQRRHIEDDLVLPMLRNIGKCKRGKSNWQSFHNAAMFLGGAVIGDARFMRRAIFDPKHGFLFQMRVSVSDDGMWYENSWGYHFYTMNALVALAESGRRCGVDLWGHPKLRRMFTLPTRYTMADGRLPRFGDDVNSSIGRVRYLFEIAHAATGDPAYRRVLPATPSWESIRFGRFLEAIPATPPASAVFRGAGHAILRGKGPAGLTAAFTFGPFGGFHGHFDKLSFVWHGFGQELGVDPGRARSQAYRLPVHRLWYRGTIAHNAVVVDGRSQKGAAGELLAFEQGDDFVAVAARCTKAYPGVEHARCLVLTDDYLVVLDRLRSDAAHRYHWIYHDRGKTVACAAADGAAKSVDLTGEEFLDIAGSGATDGEIAAQFGGRNVTTSLRIAGGTASIVHRGTGVGSSVVDRVPLVIVERSGKIVEFAAVFTAGTSKHPVPVTGVRGGARRVTIRLGGRGDDITWSRTNRIRVRRGR